MKRRVRNALLCLTMAGVLLGCPIHAAAAAETEPTEATASASEEPEEENRTGFILGFLAIFTVTCAGTAYVVMRPSLKKLKQARQDVQHTKES